jgi:hypothetical protein
MHQQACRPLPPLRRQHPMLLQQQWQRQSARQSARLGHCPPSLQLTVRTGRWGLHVVAREEPHHGWKLGSTACPAACRAAHSIDRMAVSMHSPPLQNLLWRRTHQLHLDNPQASWRCSRKQLLAQLTVPTSMHWCWFRQWEQHLSYRCTVQLLHRLLQHTSARTRAVN